MGDTTPNRSLPYRVMDEEERADGDRLVQDAELVKRCIAGEVAAWEELYSLCNEPLLKSIDLTLGFHSCDRTLAEEIAAQVWYRLVQNDGELLDRYDVSRGARIITFLRAIARDLIFRHLRSERRRRRREAISKEGSLDYSLPEDRTVWSEFLAMLTPRETDVLISHLGHSGDEEIAGTSGSRHAFWQATSRLRKRFRAYFSKH